MSSQPASRSARLSCSEQLRYARHILQQKSQTLAQLATRLDHDFYRPVGYLYECREAEASVGGLLSKQTVRHRGPPEKPEYCVFREPKEGRRA